MTAPKIGLTRRMALAAGLAAPAVLAARIPLARAAAPMLGAAAPTFHRFKLGSFEITTISDGTPVFDGPHPIFGEDQPEAVVQTLMAENNLPTSKTTFFFSPVVVNTGDNLVLFDTGNAASNRPARGLMKQRLADAGYTPEAIDVVVITHFHGDHIGGLMEDGKPSYPNARYVTGEIENNFWTHPDRRSGPTENSAKTVQATVVPLAEKTTFIKPGNEAVSGVTALEAFGHTPGHMGYHLESDGERFVIFADTTNHFVASLQRPEWHVRFDMDKEGAAATRKKILGMLAAEKIPAAGYHMPFPSVGFIEETGNGYRWVPASYQFDI